MDGFDYDEIFGDEYLHFYGPRLTNERSDTEAETIRSLVDPVGKRILDAPCGHGRIGNRLARMGGLVTGIDLAPHFLELARRQAADWGVDVNYREGDLLALGDCGEFDVVVNWFTSFGY